MNYIGLVFGAAFILAGLAALVPLGIGVSRRFQRKRNRKAIIADPRSRGAGLAEASIFWDFEDSMDAISQIPSLIFFGSLSGTCILIGVVFLLVFSG